MVWTACRLSGVIGVRSAVRRARRRWGSKVSPKLFVAKEYVLKHIRLKHADKVDAQRERVRAGFRARARVSAWAAPAPSKPRTALTGGTGSVACGRLVKAITLAAP